MELSAITVNYGGSVFLEKAVASLLPALSRIGGELLVYDNGPEDEGLARIVSSSPLIRSVEGERDVSFARANNLCAARSKGERIFFFNPDIEGREGALEALVHFLDGEPRCGAVGPRLVDPKGALEISRAPDPGIFSEAAVRLSKRLPLPLRRLFWERRVPLECGWVSAAAVLFRRKAFTEAGGFDESFPLYFEDADLCRRIREAGWEVWYAPASTMVHAKGHAAGPTRSPAERSALSRVDLSYRKGQLLYYAKWRSALEQDLLHLYLKHKLRRHPRVFEELLHWIALHGSAD